MLKTFPICIPVTLSEIKINQKCYLINCEDRLRNLFKCLLNKCAKKINFPKVIDTLVTSAINATLGSQSWRGVK